MAGRTFRCKLITPEARVLDEECSYVQLPLHDGQAGIMFNRAPLMAKLGLGELRLDGAGGGSKSFLLDGGFAQMVGNSLTLLAERAIPAEEIDEAEAKAEVAEADARTPDTAADMARVAHDRERARAKLRLAQKRRG